MERLRFVACDRRGVRRSVSVRLLLVVLEEAELLVHEGDDGVLAQVGVAIEVPARPGLVAGLPAEREVGAEQRQPGARPIGRGTCGVEEGLGIGGKVRFEAGLALIVENVEIESLGVENLCMSVLMR